MLGQVPSGRPLRVGVCGSGHWARVVHLPALAVMPGVELAGIWGRSPEQSAALAGQFGAPAFADFDALLSDVDVVSFAVPPSIQAAMALRAAEAGKHLLLEKPMATSLADADRLVRAIEDRRLSAVTFLMRLFLDDVNGLIARARAGNHVRAEAKWSSRALLPGTPFTNSAWRNGDNGTLWDLGPHVLSIFISVFGPVAQVGAKRVRKAKFECRFLHANGAESSVTLDQMDDALTKGSFEQYVFSGDDEEARGGPFTVEPISCYRVAFGLLTDGLGQMAVTASNLRLSRNIVAVLEAASFSIEANGAAVDVQP